MSSRFIPLSTIDELDQALLASHNGPIVLFKHSLTCGTSAMAYEEMEMLLARDATVDIYLVPVQTSRALSQAIAARFGVRHESPQVFVIVNGQVCWHRAHFHVTTDQVRAAIDSCASSANRVKLAATS